MTYYILDDNGDTRSVGSDASAWAQWHRDHPGRRIVTQTVLGDGVEVSTVFLGIDHAFAGGPPLLFETMVFGGAYDQLQWRYTTRQQAAAGHQWILAALAEGRDPHAGPTHIPQQLPGR